MTSNHSRLPQLSARKFITDGGLETTLVFHEGWDLPHFASYPLAAEPRGRQALRDYYRTYFAIARETGSGFILESPTWRANPDWVELIEGDRAAFGRANRTVMELMHELRAEFQRTSGQAKVSGYPVYMLPSATPAPNRTDEPSGRRDAGPILISGCIGPRGDGYDPGQLMSVDEARDYHSAQIEVLAESGADFVTAMTLNNVPEAIGIVRAATAIEIPVVISFTVELDGRLPTGESLGQAIQDADAATGDAAAYFMINCAHPTHFGDVLSEGGAWVKRIRGLRANASCRSHEELDNSTDLDAGDPAELAEQHRELIRSQPQITILGGCCGTDDRHIAALASRCLPSGSIAVSI